MDSQVNNQQLALSETGDEVINIDNWTTKNVLLGISPYLLGILFLMIYFIPKDSKFLFNLGFFWFLILYPLGSILVFIYRTQRMTLMSIIYNNIAPLLFGWGLYLMYLYYSSDNTSSGNIWVALLFYWYLAYMLIYFICTFIVYLFRRL